MLFIICLINSIKTDIKTQFFPSNYHNGLSSPTETTHWVHERKRVPPHVLFQVNLWAITVREEFGEHFSQKIKPKQKQMLLVLWLKTQHENGGGNCEKSVGKPTWHCHTPGGKEDVLKLFHVSHSSYSPFVHLLLQQIAKTHLAWHDITVNLCYGQVCL